jgi:hypothetical protein
MHRLGMVLDHHAELEYEGSTFLAVVHAITADQWRTQTHWITRLYLCRCTHRPPSLTDGIIS